ncbi:MAG: phosphatase PAP2 family protein [Myxococcales bacterium]|nr:phosphatase PAP2 family protein [Myxococcales bacterium]
MLRCFASSGRCVPARFAPAAPPDAWERCVVALLAGFAVIVCGAGEARAQAVAPTPTTAPVAPPTAAGEPAASAPTEPAQAEATAGPTNAVEHAPPIPSKATARNPRPARSEANPEGLACKYCGPTVPSSRSAIGLHWHDQWRRVGYAEAITIGVATSVTVAHYLVKPEGEPHWSSPILYDKVARDQLRFGSRSGRANAATVSDALIVGSLVAPVLVDNVLVTWVGHQSPDVAWQMAVINAQAYSLTLSLNAVSKRFVARERPYVRECRDNRYYSVSCDSPEQYQSFYSGHAAFTATGAGLTCAHHTQLALYGSPLLDGGACVLAIGLTTATGMLRISSDSHWASDVLVGHLMGYASGYLMPSLLYYRKLRLSAAEPHPAAEPVQTAIIPFVSNESAELRMIGMF